ncbi:protein DpdJ [Pseudomonas sp. NPDC090592]|uniref:protein DpdJ n=1 Tax=Pseudomonas sp. NPDC090592 TaxID=3364480 RepID=UPI00383B6332
MSITLNELHACLDKLEEHETRLLVWGDTGGFFSEQEVLHILEEVLPDHDSYDVRRALIKHAMLIEVPHPEGLMKVYRTRMGEAAHLYRNLRQWFLKQPIDRSRTLVSDFRFLRRPRSYPKRDQDPAQLLPQWLQWPGMHASEYLKAAIESLLESARNPLDLAGFQTRSTSRILQAFSAHRNGQTHASGTIVCAGTGSGKTLSFYLPGLAALAADLLGNHTPRVRILAVYPRNELLKDQFMEAWTQCRKLDGLMQAGIGRKIRIGALYGDTPTEWQWAGVDFKTKKPSLAFDLLRCSSSSCGGKMEWIASLQEVKCNRCGHRVADDEVALTRHCQADIPPDILFTTTEMLNRKLGDYSCNHLFGVGPQAGPTLVLLDEVHTYGGSSGAQTAYLLRRWMRRAQCRPHFVGLSATLTDAARFFAELVGARQERVELVEPLPDEMFDEGAEYLMVLRGDPVSQTALLSTTIQASMLTRRILDARKGCSKGTWGSKTFVFTDDLDANNRLYHQLADAEGWRTNKWGLTPHHPTLASLRGPKDGQGVDEQEAVHPLERVRLGQDWRVGTDIGHLLSEDDRAVIGRTSSQDVGVDADAEIVVATASLEVGFNDPAVGAVLQHKAPRDVASYLQRKGRAGRSRTMRPWMLVVLSEFGRDRVAFQRYEELLSPEIKRQSLPLHNSHIQKMQAAMALLDWLSEQLGSGAVWTILRKPQANRSGCKRLLVLVEQLLQPGSQQDEFTAYLKDALHVDNDALLRILWAPPRSVMLELLPALQRKLVTDWCANGQLWEDLAKGSSPLPEFIPEALFAELSLPSLFIALVRGVDVSVEWTDLPIFQALREFAPGRISKRYAIDSNLDADWLIPASFVPEPGVDQQSEFEVFEAFGEQLRDEGLVGSSAAHPLTVLRPSVVYTRRLEPKLNLTEKSNARLVWQAEFRVPSLTEVHEPPVGSWGRHLTDVTFCLHQQMTPLEVVRFSTAANASLRFTNGENTRVRFDWQRRGEPVAIGARQWVDGMRLRFQISDQVIGDMLPSPQVLRGLRPLFFRHLVDQLDILDGDPFKANWIAECYLAALAGELFDLDPTEVQPLTSALTRLHTTAGIERLRKIPQSLFQPDEQLDSVQEQKLQADLRELLARDDLLICLQECARALWVDVDLLPELPLWSRTLLANTLAAAAQRTMCVLLPDVDERAVLADAVWLEDCLEIWLSESEAGGNGIISRLEQVYFDDPLRVLNTLARSLQPSDYEQIDFDLYQLLGLVVPGGNLADALASVRGAGDLQCRREANAELHRLLLSEGFALSHSFLSVLYSRALRPGSNDSTDAALFELLSAWRALEADSGLEWALNIAAHALASKDLGKQATPVEVFQGLCRNQGLLWPRGNAIRQSEMSYYNPFQNGVATTERLLGSFLFAEQEPLVQLSSGYLAELHGVLCRAGRADLLLPRTQITNISQLIAEIQLQPVDHLGLWLYPRIGAMARLQDSVVLRIELAEAIQ